MESVDLDMPQECFSKIEPLLIGSPDMMKIQILFVHLLAVFKLTLKDFTKYIESSLPKAVSATESFWGFILCPCKMKKPHISIKKCFPVDTSLSVNFDKDELEIVCCNEFNWKFLTHLFISFLRVNQGKWGSSQVSASVLHHKVGELLEKFVADGILKEEEDEAMSRSLKRFRERTEEIATGQKKTKIIENVGEKKERKHNFQSLAKAAIAFVVGEQSFASDEAKKRGKIFKGEVEEMKPLLREICNLKNQQEMATLFGDKEESEFTTHMQEALDKIFQLKAKLVSEARDFVNQLHEEEQERQRRQEEEERRRKEEEDRQRRQEEERLREEEEEKKKEREKENEAILIQVAQQQEEQEEGEINEIERFRIYYKKAVNVAAYYAHLANQYIPCTRNLNQYSNHELRFMIARNRTAMASIEDVLASRQRREGNGFWHGPQFRDRPSDFPDFDIALSKF